MLLYGLLVGTCLVPVLCGGTEPYCSAIDHHLVAMLLGFELLLLRSVLSIYRLAGNAMAYDLSLVLLRQLWMCARCMLPCVCASACRLCRRTTSGHAHRKPAPGVSV